MREKLSLNTESIPNELKLILKLINLEDLVDLVDLKKELEIINWDLFLQLAIHHRIYPLLFKKIKKLDLTFPTGVEETLNNAYRKNSFEMLYLSGELERVSKILNENDIRMLVLKGPVLAKDLYGDISHRTCGDLDLLVTIKDLDKVDKLLLEQGYLKDDFINKEINDWKWRNHHIKYFHPQRNLNIEIHWRLNPFPGSGPNFEKLWLRKRQSSVTVYPIYYLGREDLFLFLVSHGARHGWFRLRWLVDIHQMANQELNWDFMIKQLKRYQYFLAGGQAIILAHGLLNTPIKKEMNDLLKGGHSQRLAQDAIFFFNKIVNLHSVSVPIEVEQYHKQHLLQLMTKKQRFVYLLSFLYPYPLDAQTLPLPKYLHILYFPLRPFLWAWRKTRKHALP